MCGFRARSPTSPSSTGSARSIRRRALAHAFASTEAGLAFEVNDRRAGFPASVLGAQGGVELKIIDGSLRIRSPRTARRYLGDGALAGPDGFVDTGDMVELAGERYHFAGRRDGIINVGGQKVHPEEVEAVINSHPSVEMARAKARRNPFTGAVVVAEVVAKSGSGDDALERRNSGHLPACAAGAEGSGLDPLRCIDRRRVFGQDRSRPWIASSSPAAAAA